VILSDLPDVHDNHVRLGFVSANCDACQGNCAICVLDVPAVEPQSWTRRAAAHTLPTCAVGGVITSQPDSPQGGRETPHSSSALRVAGMAPQPA
jgi:hypothetical protein